MLRWEVSHSDSAARVRRGLLWGVLALFIVGVARYGRPLIACARYRMAHRRAAVLPGHCTFHDIAVREPSGVAYHAQRGSLLVVSDEGFVDELDLDFRVLTRYAFDGDIEGVAVHPQTGTIFVAIESDGAIVEYDLELRRVLRRIVVDFHSHADFASGRIGRNKGLEGVTIRAPGGSDDAWQLIAVVEDSPPRLIVLSTDVSADATERSRHAAPGPALETARIVASYDLGMERLSSVDYDPTSGLLVAISSRARTACCVDRRGRVSRIVRIAGDKPEGVCFLPDGRAIIVQDTGGLCVCDGLSRWMRSPAVFDNGGTVASHLPRS